jgi:hypothetical protein
LYSYSSSSILTLIGIWESPMNMPPVIFGTLT